MEVYRGKPREGAHGEVWEVQRGITVEEIDRK